jgi:hypothetical protein
LPLIFLLSLTALTSAFLLLWVEPLFARLALPLLGGSPAVWNTCLMYFQAALLGGYLYAHVTSRYLDIHRQGILHLVLLALALFALPIAIPPGWTPPDSGDVVAWLAALLTVAVGVPFLILSATAPLLQRWMAGVDHLSARDPYVLYAASNTGSLLGLLAFPLLLEPELRLGQQSALWTAGYLLLTLLMVACVALLWRQSRVRDLRADPRAAPAHPVEGAAPSTPPSAAPTLRDRARWVALAFVPSSLLLGVTTYLSTDVAAMPLLWVVPLTLYLLTFIIVFARRSLLTPRVALLLHTLLVPVFVVIVFWRVGLDQRWEYPLHLGIFAVTALVLHGELAAARPSPTHLTEYYLWIALGGALGGAFNAILAPLLFHTVVEYQAMMVLACFLRPSRPERDSGWLERLQSLSTAALPALLLAVVVTTRITHYRVLGISVAWLSTVAAAAIVVAQRANALRFGASVAGLAAAGLLLFQPSRDDLFAGRSFFGAYRVSRAGPVRMLYHGTTIHGAQFADVARRSRPLTYYHPAGPVGQVFQALEGRLGGRQIGVVGLGAGSLLCYATPGQEWTVYEIDPLIVRIARDPAYFTYLRDCPVRPKIVLGDARLTLAREPSRRFALLVLDAFSSDAIPVHLLTREALALYGRLLEPDGALLIHVSNKHLDLEPVVAALARDAGLAALAAEHEVDPVREEKEMDYSCDWVLLTRRSEDARSLVGDARWRQLTAGPGQQLWTDDYSNVFRAMRW